MWGNLTQKIEMGIGHLVSKHGATMIKDFSKLVDVIMKVADAFAKLIEKTRALEIIGEIFKGWGMIFDLISTGVDKLVAWSGMGDKVQDMKNGQLKKNPVAMLNDWFGGKLDDHIDKSIVMPKLGPIPHNPNKVPGAPASSLVVNNYGVENANDAVDGFQKAVDRSYRASPVHRETVSPLRTEAK
jgi:hypothetical protein